MTDDREPSPAPVPESAGPKPSRPPPETLSVTSETPAAPPGTPSTPPPTSPSAPPPSPAAGAAFGTETLAALIEPRPDRAAQTLPNLTSPAPSNSPPSAPRPTQPSPLRPVKDAAFDSGERRLGADLHPRQEVAGGSDAPPVASGGAETINSSASEGLDSATDAAPCIGRYRLQERLGEGGMGVVWKAWDPELGRTVALKQIRGGALSDTQSIERFLREARLAGRLRHPNIVAVHDVGASAGLHYLAMDYVDGRTFDEYLAETREEKRAGARSQTARLREEVALLAQVAEGVAYAHGQGVVHRDLKPANVLVGRDGQAVVMDFGLARELAGAKPVGAAEGTAESGARGSAESAEEIERRLRTLTATGQVLGTPYYMSPEQVDGNPDAVGPWTDTWALGVMLYEILTGTLPFAASTPLAALAAVVTTEPVPPRTRNRHTPPELERVCLKAIEKPPARRYRSAAELAEELRRWLRGEPVHARPVGRAYRAWRWAARNRVLAAAGAALSATSLVLLLLAGGPGFLAIDSAPPGARVLVNDRATGRETPIGGLWIWPPGDTLVTIVAEGRLPHEERVRVHPLATTRVQSSLASDTGFLSVAVEPASAELVLRLAGREAARLRGAQARTPLHVGTYLAEANAPDHEPIATAFEIASAAETRLPPIRLRHEHGRLTLTSSVEGVTALVYPLPTGEEPDGRLRTIAESELPSGPPLLRLPAQLEDYPLDTGSYRFVWVKDGHFPRQTTARMSKDRSLELNTTLVPHEVWRYDTGRASCDAPVSADLNDDGVPDILVEAGGRLLALNGTGNGPLWTCCACSMAIPLIADLDGDGRPDVVVASDAHTLTAHSGARGTTLWAHRFESTVSMRLTAADIDGDGWAEIAVRSKPGFVHLLAGIDGRVVATHKDPNKAGSGLLSADLDGDGADDLLLEGSDGRLHALHGRDGHPLWSRETGPLYFDHFSRFEPADLSGDGIPDLVVATGQPPSTGTILAFSGKDGSPLWRAETGLNGPSPSPPADLNGDGVPDFAIGSQAGPFLALSGRDGSVLWREASHRRPSFPRIADLDGDGRPEIVVVSDTSRMTACSGADGRPLWTVTGEISPRFPLLADLDGDGCCEIVNCHDRRVIVSRVDDGFLRWMRKGPFVHENDPRVQEIPGLPAVVVSQVPGGPIGLSALDGGTAWRLRAPAGECTSPAGFADLDGDGSPEAIAGWRLATGAAVLAISVADGRTVWSFPTESEVRRPILLADRTGDGVLDPLFMGIDGKVRALSGRDAKLLWSLDSTDWWGSALWQQEVDGDGAPDLVLKGKDGEAEAVSGRDGHLLWRHVRGELTTFLLAVLDPAGAGEPIVVESATNITRSELRGSRGRDGTLAWTRPTSRPILGPPLVADMNRDGTLDVALHEEHGWLCGFSGPGQKWLWTLTTAGENPAKALADIDGEGAEEMVVVDETGVVYGVRPTDGAVRWTRRLHAGAGVGSTRMAVRADLDRDGSDEVLLYHYSSVTCLGRPKRPRPGPAEGAGAVQAPVPTADPGAATAWQPRERFGGSVPPGAFSLNHGAVLGALHQAEAALAKRPKGAPNQVALLRIAARAATMLRENAKADGYLKEWLDLAPRKPLEALLLGAVVQSRLGRSAEADASLALAFSQGPLELDACLKTFAAGRTQADTDYLRAATRRFAEAPPAAGGPSPLTLGMAWLFAEEPARAEACLTEALRSGEVPPAVFFYRALARARTKDLRGARDDAERAAAVSDVAEAARALLAELDRIAAQEGR
ncbi:MAG: VCBS repeat-containing protein [Planctomycetes bacterium]|nr:VCBS repeat-containing protein [Planctomycetota bacterium]